MAVYIILLCWIWILYMLHGRKLTIQRNYLENPSIHVRAKRDVILMAVPFALLIAFRDLSVGIDTVQYEYNFSRINPDILTSGDFFSQREWGYKLIQAVIKLLGMDFRALLFVESVLYIVPVAYVIYKYSRNPYFSFFMFLAVDYYLFSMTAIRQSIALGITLLAFDQAVRNKKFRFVITVLIASTFHTTALVFLPVIILSKIPLRKRYVFLALVLSFALNAFKDPIRQLMMDLAHNPYVEMETGGMGMHLFMISMVLLDLMWGKNAGKHWVDADLITYMMICAVAVYPVLQFNPAVFRLHYYYSVMMIIYVPNVLKRYRDNRTRWGLTLGYYAIIVYYMFQYTFQIMGAVPYQFGF